MRMHFIVATLLVAPWVTAAAQDTTRMRDSILAQSNSYQQAPQDSSETLSDEIVLARMHQTHQQEIKMGQLAQRNGSAKVKSYGARLVKDHTAAEKKVTAVAKKLGFSTMSAIWKDSTGASGHDHMKSDSAYNQPGDSLQARQRADTATQREKQEHAELMRRLGTLRGAAFDSVFANAMVQGHQKTIGMLETAQNQAQSANQAQSPEQEQNPNQAQRADQTPSVNPARSAEVRTLIVNTLPTVREHLRIAQSLTTTTTTTSSSQQ